MRTKRTLKMATVGIRFKIMPESIDTNLEELKVKLKDATESFESGVFNDTKEEPIAFGLKALIVTIALSEDEESDAVEKAFKEIEGVSSVELIDYRRAVG
jgi:elongation factor 1-beta